MARIVSPLFIAVLALVWPLDGSAQIEMAKSVVGAGGGDMGGDAHTLRGTIGQSVIGVTESSSHIDEIGFWFQSFWVFVDVGDPWPMLPTAFWLGTNRPNPFSPRTTISYAIPEPVHVTLTLYDVSGRQIRTLVDGPVGAGYHNVVLDGRGLTSGVYYYRLRAGQYEKSRSLVLAR